MIRENFLQQHPEENVDAHEALAIWIYSLNNVMKDIYCDLKDVPDEVDFDRYLFDQDLEQDLRDLLMSCPADPFALNVDSRSINPYLSVFINSLEEEVVDQDVDHFQKVSPSLLLVRVREFLDCCKFYDALANLQRNERATCTSLLQYIFDLKAAYSKLMIIRLDLYTSSYLAVVPHWEQLKKYVADRYAGAYVGFAVKFEYGKQRGVHMHTMLFFNGSLVRQDVTIAKAIGEHWKSCVTAGKGSYSNCNAPHYLKRMYYPAVGTFHQFDDHTLNGLRHISRYLTEQDLTVRFAVPGLARTLRKGGISKDKRSRIEMRAKRLTRAKGVSPMMEPSTNIDSATSVSPSNQ